MRGLSPLARGTRPDTSQTPKQERFIPAGAGNTQMLRPAPRLGAVYPRWRGEHVSAASAISNTRGLSPLARGTQNIA